MDNGRGLGVDNAANLFSSIFITHCYITSCLQRLRSERAICNILLVVIGTQQIDPEPICQENEELLRKTPSKHIVPRSMETNILQTRKQSLCAKNSMQKYIVEMFYNKINPKCTLKKLHKLYYIYAQCRKISVKATHFLNRKSIKQCDFKKLRIYSITFRK